jgi:CrcB protein
MQLSSLLAVGAGGAIGSMLRYALSVLITERVGAGFPWATLAINVTGSFILALIAESASARVIVVQPAVRLMLTVGFVGGYTTFSTFTYELLTAIGERAVGTAAAYLLASVAGGLLAAYLGVIVARLAEGVR